MRKKINLVYNHDSVYVVAETQANIFNLKFLGMLAFLAAATELLNDVNIFSIQRVIMIPVMITAIICFLIPLIVFIIHDFFLKRTPTILSSPNFKTIILIAIFIGITLVGVVLSFHAVLLIVIPALMEAQYRYNRRMAIAMFIATILIVPITVYGSFFWGLADRNFFKFMLTDEEATEISNRIAIATSKRMIELLLHYVAPRVLGVVSVNVLVISISKRSAKMLDRQELLRKTVQKEMSRRSNMQNHVIEDLAGIIETRDTGTGEHVIRVKKYINLIARELQKTEKYKKILTDETIEQIVQASPLHDVGKIAVPDYILLKPGRYTSEEFEQMKIHTVKGGEMIDSIFANFGDKELLEKAYNIAEFHHEKWDGTGYPDGLRAREIPLEARMMAIADVYDALVSKRVYKEPMAPKDAFQIILNDAGTHFDPEIVQAISGLEEEFEKIATADEFQEQVKDARLSA